MSNIRLCLSTMVPPSSQMKYLSVLLHPTFITLCVSSSLYRWITISILESSSKLHHSYEDQDERHPPIVIFIPFRTLCFRWTSHQDTAQRHSPRYPFLHKYIFASTLTSVLHDKQNILSSVVDLTRE